MKENVLQIKSFDFAVCITKFFREQKIKDPIFVQLLRSGTSIGANVEEAIGAISRKDFILKLTISYKEARETLYWLQLLEATDASIVATTKPLIDKCIELIKLLASLLKTTKSTG